MYVPRITTHDYSGKKPLIFKSLDMSEMIKDQTLTLADVSIYNRFDRERIYLAVKNKGDFVNKGIDVYDAESKVATLQPIAEDWCKTVAQDEIFYDITQLSKNDIKYTFDISGLNFNANIKAANYDARVELNSKYHGGVSNVIKSGTARGRYFNVTDKNTEYIEELLINAKKPLIFYIGESDASFLRGNYYPNLAGFIIQSRNTFVPQTSHISSEFRTMTDVCIVTDPSKEIIPDKMNGKYIELTVAQNGNCRYRVIPKEKVVSKVRKSIADDLKITKYDRNKKDILLPEQCTLDVIGTKAVNLNKLKVLSEKGVIDVIVPKFIGLPYGYIVNMFASNPKKLEHFEDIAEPYLCGIPYDVCKKDASADSVMNKLKNILKANGLNAKNLMVRSSFNMEDLPPLNTAGIFISCEESVGDNSGLFRNIYNVAASKRCNSVVAASKRYGIPMEDIQPGVILQNKINTDYKFTIYTDDGHGNLIMEFFQASDNDPEFAFSEGTPACKVTYNKEQKAIKIQPNLANTITKKAITSKAGDTVALSYMYEMHLYNSSVFQDTLKKIINNALIVEKEFGGPQDIEGGFNINRLNSALMRVKTALNMTDKTYLPRIKGVYTAEKAVIGMSTLMTGLSYGSIKAAIYGFLASSLACVVHNNINYLKQLHRFHDLYSISTNRKTIKNIINNNNIYFWQTRNVVDLFKRIR